VQPAAHKLHQRIGAGLVVEVGFFCHLQIGEGIVIFTAVQHQPSLDKGRNIETVNIRHDRHIVFHQGQQGRVEFGTGIRLPRHILHDDSAGVVTPAVDFGHQNPVGGEYFHIEGLGFQPRAALATHMQAQDRTIIQRYIDIPRRAPARQFVEAGDGPAKVVADPAGDIFLVDINGFYSLIHNATCKFYLRGIRTRKSWLGQIR